MKKYIIFSNSFKLIICTLIDNKFQRRAEKLKKDINGNVYKMFQLF